ncbi:hypothetical protein [Gluconobacter oxydans]|uniref:hypothetical protein n=1 Tax=Gluconobacter oxydans TaxID=442 RepID=UPI0007809D16|nr:hypothetical protein [Gluconobacter oxydans]KXV13931.1 hypothetical protein AD932_03305 [Gluconobacter oxydans]
MGEALLASPADTRVDDHERRITALEQGMTSIQLKLVEVQTEGRMRGERQDVDLRDLKGMTRDLLGGMAFFKTAFTWVCGAIAAVLIFIAIWGPKLLTFWRDWHHV